MSSLGPSDAIHLYAHIGDLKDMLYRQALVIGALLDVLATRGLTSLEEVATRAAELDSAALPLGLEGKRGGEWK